MTWLITGGAGYIGAHVVAETLKSGREAIVLDDLSTGIKDRIPAGVKLVNSTLTDIDAVESCFAENKISGVLHLAAKKQVGESVARPDYYWEQNIGGLNNLLTAMSKHKVKNFVFSSSAAVYGQPELLEDELITELTNCSPINPYGATKLVGEWLAKARVLSDGFSVAALRYFNVAGAGRPELGDVFAFNLVPIVLQALTDNTSPKIFGDDYATVDGTCIRDYIHVQDLAEAHVAAMDLVESRTADFDAINIGTGKGSSVREVIEQIEKTVGQNLNAVVAERRAGDPAQLVADVTEANVKLGWKSQYDLVDIVESAWEAWNYKAKG